MLTCQRTVICWMNDDDAKWLLLWPSLLLLQLLIVPQDNTPYCTSQRRSVSLPVLGLWLFLVTVSSQTQRVLAASGDKTPNMNAYRTVSFKYISTIVFITKTFVLFWHQHNGTKPTLSASPQEYTTAHFLITFTIRLKFVCTAININYSVPAAQLQPTHNPCFRQHFIKAYYAAKFTKCILTVSLQCPFQPEALLLMQHYINYKPLNARSWLVEITPHGW